MSQKHLHVSPTNIHVPLNMDTACEELTVNDCLENNSKKDNEACAIKSGASVSLKFPSHSSSIHVFHLSDFPLPCEISENRKYILSIFTGPALCPTWKTEAFKY